MYPPNALINSGVKRSGVAEPQFNTKAIACFGMNQLTARPAITIKDQVAEQYFVLYESELMLAGWTDVGDTTKIAVAGAVNFDT